MPTFWSNIYYIASIYTGKKTLKYFHLNFSALLIIIQIPNTHFLKLFFSENPWENKAVFMLYTELVIGLLKVILYALFIVIMVRIYTLPLFAVRPMYLTARAFKKALRDVVSFTYKSLWKYFSGTYVCNFSCNFRCFPEEQFTIWTHGTLMLLKKVNWFHEEKNTFWKITYVFIYLELANSDNVCIICREEMQAPSTKKLPCGHIFHKNCLRSWFQVTLTILALQSPKWSKN